MIDAPAVSRAGRVGFNWLRGSAQGTVNDGSGSFGSRVDLASTVLELAGLLLEPLLQRRGLGNSLLGGVPANVLGNFHGAEVRAAHAAEVCALGAFLGERLVVEFPGCGGIEAEIELVLPSKFKSSLG